MLSLSVGTRLLSANWLVASQRGKQAYLCRAQHQCLPPYRAGSGPALVRDQDARQAGAGRRAGAG